MKDIILDDDSYGNNEISSLNDVKKALQQAGITSFYEHKNGYILVEEGDAVRVAIYYENGATRVDPKFPRIGNSVQIVISGIILAFFLWGIAIPFPAPWILAIAGGQLASLLINKPKTKKLKERIERFL